MQVLAALQPPAVFMRHSLSFVRYSMKDLKEAILSFSEACYFPDPSLDFCSACHDLALLAQAAPTRPPARSHHSTVIDGSISLDPDNGATFRLRSVPLAQEPVCQVRAQM